MPNPLCEDPKHVLSLPLAGTADLQRRKRRLRSATFGPSGDEKDLHCSALSRRSGGRDSLARAKNAMKCSVKKSSVRGDR